MKGGGIISRQYYDEEACRKLVSMYGASFGQKRAKCLNELCRYRTKAADGFWRDKIYDESMLPYIMMCRGDGMSDYAADRLSDFIDRACESPDYRNKVNEAYFLLHVCMFKESDRLTDAYAKAGRKYKELMKADICWGGDMITPEGQPDFLYQRYLSEKNCCEDTFFGALTDTIILTAANAMELDGEDETFTAKVKELYGYYPEVFAEAGFYAYFINDTSEAYDKFSDYLLDPITYPRLFWALDGFSCEDGCYIQGSPTTFVGPDNKKLHFSAVIDRVDFRWYEFFTEKLLEDAENMTTHDPYFLGSYCRGFSARMIELINHGDEKVMEACRKYFRRAAVIAGNPADFAGLLECDCIKDGDGLSELCLDIAKRICEGRQKYCYNVLFHFFKGFSYDERLAAVSAAADYLREHENSVILTDQRDYFFDHFERFRNKEPSMFDGV